MYYQQNRYAEREKEFRSRNAKEIAKRPEVYVEKLSGMMRQMSEQINREMKEQHGLNNFLNSDGALNMDGYADDIYSKQNVQADQTEIHKRELGFVKADDANVRQFYKNTYGADTPEKMIAHWREGKKKTASGQMEMAITGLLHKVLKDKFLIVRSAPHDDYDNGVDNIILDRESGQVVGAFDEVHEGGAGERTGEKIEKIKKVAGKGGARVRYGLKLQDDKIKRAEMKNIPVFYLSLMNNELVGLLNNMDYNPNSPLTPKEKEVFDKLVASIKEQLPILKNAGFSEQKLDTFITSLTKQEQTGTA